MVAKINELSLGETKMEKENKPDFIEIINENIINAYLTDLDLNQDVGIGENNTSKFIRFERLSDNKIKMQGFNLKGDSLTFPEICFLEDVGRKISTKRNPMIKDLIKIYGLDELPSFVEQRLRTSCRYVLDKWLNSGFCEFADSLENVSGHNFFSEDEQKKILDFSMNPKMLDVVQRQLDKEIVGETGNKMLLWISLAQSLTKYYVDLLLIGDSAIGKTWLIRNCLKLYPTEFFLEYGRISKTAPEHKKDLNKYRLLYIREKWGSRSADSSLRFSSKWDEGSTSLVYNAEHGENEELIIPPMAKISTQISEIIDGQDLTRTTLIYPDPTEEQTKKIVEYQAEEREIIKVLNLKNDEEEIIKSWLRIMRKDLTVIIPYSTLLAKSIDTAFLRMRRDFTNIQDMISIIAILHQKQREWIDENTILANEQDFLITMKFINEYTASYLNLSTDNKRLYDLIKGLENWATYPSGVPRDIINEEVDKKLHKKSYWTWDKIQKLLEERYIVSEEKTIVVGDTHTRKIFYRTSENYMNSILREHITVEDIRIKIEDWKNKNIYPDTFSRESANLQKPNIE